MKTCAHCGKLIGYLQEERTDDGEVVCRPCAEEVHRVERRAAAHDRYLEARRAKSRGGG